MVNKLTDSSAVHTILNLLASRKRSLLKCSTTKNWLNSNTQETLLRVNLKLKRFNCWWLQTR